jgi:hypothetical protein
MPPPNVNGWNNTDVTVTVTAEDYESGIRETHYSFSGAQSGGATIYSGIASFEISAEGATTVTYSAGDNAGNQETSRSLTIRVDKSPPQVGVTCPAAASLRSAAGAQVIVTDALSGVVSQTTPNSTAILDTSTVGPRVLTVTAEDRAGNVASGACSYQVLYDFMGGGGFRPPLVAPPEVNGAKAGWTIPVTWQLPDGGGGFVSDLSVVLNVAIQRMQCSGLVPSLQKELPRPAAGGSSVLHYDTVANQFIYYWKTDASMRGNCYALTLSLDDGTEHTAHFALK